MSTIGPGFQKDAFQNDAFQWNDPPSAPSINVPVASTAYSGTLGLDATVTDGASMDSVPDTVFAAFEYDRNDGNWVAIGSGSVVASGGSSTYVWDITLFTPGFNYRVRAKATDQWSQESGWTTTGTFIIGPGFSAIFAVPATTDAYRNEVLADAPVAYYRLGETSGTVAKDASGNGHDGTYVGGVTLGAAGAVDDDDGAASFIATSYVDLGDVAALKPAYVTAELWLRTSGHSGMPIATPPSPYGYDIYINPTGTPRWELDGVLLPVTSSAPSQVVNDGAWHHLVGTYDGARGKLYLDSILVVDFSYAGGALEYAAGSVNINRRSDVGGQICTIDEVAIYATALSPTRIAAHYEAARRLKGPFVAETDVPSYYAESLVSGYSVRRI